MQILVVSIRSYYISYFSWLVYVKIPYRLQGSSLYYYTSVEVTQALKINNNFPKKQHRELKQHIKKLQKAIVSGMHSGIP